MYDLLMDTKCYSGNIWRVMVMHFSQFYYDQFIRSYHFFVVKETSVENFEGKISLKSLCYCLLTLTLFWIRVIKGLLCILSKIYFKRKSFYSRKFGAFAVFDPFRESLCPRNFSKVVIRERFCSRNNKDVFKFSRFSS